MNEYMLLIRNAKDAKSSLSAEDHLAFIQQCEVYIDMLKSQNKLIAAQPLIREGTILSKSANDWYQHELSLHDEIQVGYYHIRADDMEEAIQIARNNPEFEYVASATIEVRPIKTKEADTQFVYPAGA
jgi:hypothetical protein